MVLMFLNMHLFFEHVSQHPQKVSLAWDAVEEESILVSYFFPLKYR